MVEIPEGLTARVQHLRYVEGEYHTRLFTRFEWRKRGLTPKPRGGVTRVELTKDDEVVGVGEAICAPEDQFVARVGRDKATGRAISNYLHRND